MRMVVLMFSVVKLVVSEILIGKSNVIATIAGSFREYIFQHINYRIPLSSGGPGYWIAPSPLWSDGPVYYIECPHKINLMGQSHFYMDIAELNNMDETSPYSVTSATVNPKSNITNTIFNINHPNMTHGRVNTACSTALNTNITTGRMDSAFAKIAVAGLPLSLWYDINNEGNYKFFDPPAERIRRLNITIRYHNGMLVNFETFNYSFCLEFTLLNGYISKNYNMRR